MKISESCISQPETVKELKTAGYKDFMIDESFMKTVNPAKALAEFVEGI